MSRAVSGRPSGAKRLGNVLSRAHYLCQHGRRLGKNLSTKFKLGKNGHAEIRRFAVCCVGVPRAPPVWAQSVLTYHQNTLRDGWNAAEKTLNAANVGGGTFQLQATATLDSQVDAQPLVVPNQAISGQGTHTVVYVATGGDTLYAIDGSSGAILLSRNFGTPIPRSALPGGCPNNGPTIGILSTPVIDKSTGTMYLMVDTYENGSAVCTGCTLSNCPPCRTK